MTGFKNKQYRYQNIKAVMMMAACYQAVQLLE